MERLVKLGIGAFVLLILFLIFKPFVVVDPGHRGVKITLGSVSENVLQEGVHWKWPLIQSIKEINVQTQKNLASASSASKDMQVVTTQIAVNYNLDPEFVTVLYQEIGMSYETKVIDPLIQETVKAITAQYTAVELITKRAEVKTKVADSLKESLSVTYMVVTNVSMTDFDYSESFNIAIEKKVTAEQEALAAQNKLEQVKFEAEQRIEQARAEAEAIRIQAKAITQQGGANYVSLKAVEKWNGVLPVQMIPGSTVPFIKLTK